MLVELSFLANKDHELDKDEQVELLCLSFSVLSMVKEYFSNTSIVNSPGQGDATKKSKKLK